MAHTNLPDELSPDRLRISEYSETCGIGGLRSWSQEMEFGGMETISKGELEGKVRQHKNDDFRNLSRHLLESYTCRAVLAILRHSCLGLSGRKSWSKKIKIT